jgi:Domain of unknown function (DUF4440)
MASQKFLSAVLAPCLFMFSAFTLPSGIPSSAAEHADDERAIRQLNQECLKAHDIADAATLDRIEDTDFTISGEFGIVTKQEQLGKVRKRTGKPEVISRKIDPQVFRFYDGVALVTETDRPTTKDGTFAFQSTEVWVRRGDGWKLAHLHYSRLEEKQ